MSNKFKPNLITRNEMYFECLRYIYFTNAIISVNTIKKLISHYKFKLNKQNFNRIQV